MNCRTNGLVMARPTQHQIMNATFSMLGPRERRAMVHIAERLLMGQQLFGELTYMKKDWHKEASEEAFDMAVYLAAKLVDDEDRENANWVEVDDDDVDTERNPNQ